MLLRSVCLVLACLLAAGPAAAAAVLDAEAAERIVRARWFEGVPDELIAPLAPEAVARLSALLNDLGEGVTHAPALELLGRAGGPGAYEAVAAYAENVPNGEVDAAVYRAQLAVPIAFGHLARDDDRALAWLLDASGPGAAPASWRSGHLDAARTGVLRQKLAITGLALSGRPEAGEALASLASQAAPSAAAPGRSGRFTDLRAHVDDAVQVHTRTAAELGGAR